MLIELVQRRPHLRLAADRAGRWSGGRRAWDNQGARDALLTSRQGRARRAPRSRSGARHRWSSFAVERYRFFGRRRDLALLIVLPIALPGIVTGIALDSAYQPVINRSGSKGLFWVIVGPRDVLRRASSTTTVLARLRRWAGTSRRRAPTSSATCLADVPATSPSRSSGRRCSPAALLAFALVLRRDHRHRRSPPDPDIRTLPIWIFRTCSGPTRLRSINVVAAVLIVAVGRPDLSPSGSPPTPPRVAASSRRRLLLPLPIAQERRGGIPHRSAASSSRRQAIPESASGQPGCRVRGHLGMVIRR